MSKGLSRKQEAFCFEYMKDRNGQKAAERAGYSAKHARSQASRLLKLPTIANKIEKLAVKMKMDAEEALQLLGKTAREAESESVKLRALEKVIDVHGLTKAPELQGKVTLEVIYTDDWRKSKDSAS